MASFLDEIADYLADATTAPDIGTVGTDIFVNKLPTSPDNCVAILGLTGPLLASSNRHISSLVFPRFQVFIRNKDDALGAAKLADVRTKLHAKYGVLLPNWRIMNCHAEQEGGPIGTDEQDRSEFSINFIAEVNAQTNP
jgi:hypothetical protein